MTISVSDIEGFCGDVDEELMMRHLSTLARWTKVAGSEDEVRSLDYIREQLDEYGYATKYVHHPAYISLPGQAGAVVDGNAVRAITHSMSQPSPASGLAAPLIYVGEGSDADFAGKDVRGGIVLVEGMATPAIALRASQAGAVGELHISPHEHLHEMCISPVWGSPDIDTAGQMPTTVALTIPLDDGKALREKLARGESPNVVLHAEVDAGWRQIPILVADMGSPDATPETPFVLFSGHHDTWYEGVMDNGAANVTMMEVARLCAQQRALWRRSLRLCFWSGHSQGRYASSTWYADTHWRELDAHCAVHVNVDSTGGVGADDLTATPAATELAALATEALRAQAGQQHGGKRMNRNGDQSFWGVGIPSIFSIFSQQTRNEVALRNNLGWWWHTPEDLLDKIDPANLGRDTRVYVHVLFRLLCDAVLPLDIERQVDDLHAALSKIRLPDQASISLDDLLADVAALKEAARALLGRNREPSADAALAFDRTLMRVSRALVPLDYGDADRFSHLPALPQPAWPVLEPLRKLATQESGSPALHLHEVAARRALNKVIHAVGQAIDAIQRT